MIKDRHDKNNLPQKDQEDMNISYYTCTVLITSSTTEMSLSYWPIHCEQWVLGQTQASEGAGLVVAPGS